MAGKSVYSLAQWQWAADRVAEGYFIGDVAAFLGVSRWTLTRHMEAIGRKPYRRYDLAELRERKKEFQALYAPEEV